MAQFPAAQPDPTLTLNDAILRAQSNEPSYAAAVAGSRVANLDRSIARTSLLPSVTFLNQGIYTQPSISAKQAEQSMAAQSSPRFIANNGIREYVSQGVVNETLSLAQVADVHRADAAAAQAAADMEIARRGLVVAVTGLYYGVAATEHRVAIATRSYAEAEDFVRLTEAREQQREAARADVVKARLGEQQRGRELADAKLAAEKARLELGVLLFPDPRTPYTLAMPEIPGPLASRSDIEQAAAKNNPEMRSALAAIKVGDADVLAARAAYLPSLGLNYTYGIDAPQFASAGPDHTRNLGYSTGITVDIPVWDWLATHNRVKQSEIRRDVAKTALTATQRRLIAQLGEAYAEATAARDQLASLDASVQTAAESLRLTKLRYTGGEATVLEVVDAQTTYVGAENAREDGRMRYHAALANLQILTGTL